jgi:hypothetical protein
MSKTPVIFRMEGESCLAVFPCNMADRAGYDMKCFSLMYQHTSCSLEYYRSTTPAEPQAYRIVKRCLEGPPYNYDLDVRRRIPVGAFAARREA